MALTEEDIDRIGDKNKIMLLEALDTHYEKEHKPLERRIAKLNRTIYGFQILWGSVATFFGIKGH
jgi:hypothetical protein